MDEEARARVAAVLEREAARLQEDHLAAEPDAKRPLLALARLREAQVGGPWCRGWEVGAGLVGMGLGVLGGFGCEGGMPAAARPPM